MSEEIIKYIEDKLSAGFGAEYPVYTEQTAQIQIPCFMLKLLDQRQEHIGRAQYWRSCLVCLQFLAGEWELAHKTAERLFLILEKVEVSGVPVRGRKMRYDLTDKVLSFFVEYNLNIFKESV
ncbi:MAG: hypothetical protein LBU36_01220 [Clostridiales bacterium]|jgi:hypothetical protein|nr:hypothetical protein [Clostridiales bacterium]